MREREAVGEGLGAPERLTSDPNPSPPRSLLQSVQEALEERWVAGLRGGVGQPGLGLVTSLTSLPPDLSATRSLTIRPAVELQVRSRGKLGPGLGKSAAEGALGWVPVTGWSADG